MGLSSSKQTTQSTSTAAPYSPAQPYIDAGLAAANDTFNQQQPILNNLAQTAQDAYNSLAPGVFQTSPFVSGAQSAASGILGGKYVGTNPGASAYSGLASANNPALGILSNIANGDPNANPHIDGIVQQGTDAAVKAANQRFGASGLGQGNSSAYTDVVSKNVANAANSLRYQNYNDQRSQALQAASGLGSLYNAQQQTQLGAAQAADSNYNSQIAQQLQALGLTGSLSDAQYAGISPALNLLDLSAKIPYYGTQALAGTLDTLAGRYGSQSGTSTTTGSQSIGGLLGGIAGAGLAGWASGGFKGI